MIQMLGEGEDEEEKEKGAGRRAGRGWVAGSFSNRKHLTGLCTPSPSTWDRPCWIGVGGGGFNKSGPAPGTLLPVVCGRAWFASRLPPPFPLLTLHQFFLSFLFFLFFFSFPGPLRPSSNICLPVPQPDKHDRSHHVTPGDASPRCCERGATPFSPLTGRQPGV